MLKRALRVVVALTIFVWLVRQAGVQQILADLAQAEVGLILAAIGVLAAQSLAKIVIWWKILRGVLGQRGIGFWQLLCCFFTGSFFGSVVPSSASTDALRAVLTQRRFGGHIAVHAASMVSLNAVNWFAGSLLALTALAALAVQGNLPTPLQPALLLFAGIAVTLPVLYWLLGFHRALVVVGLRRVPSGWYRVRHGLRRFLDSMLIFERAKVGVWRILIVATFAMLMQPVELALTAAAVGVSVPFFALMIVAPLTALTSVLPLNVAGFGMMQAVHVYLLTHFGATTSEAFVISALLAIEVMALNVVGGLAFVFGPRYRALQSESRSLSSP